MRKDVVEIFVSSIQSVMDDREFDEFDLVETIASSDLNHQHYLLSVLLNFYYGVIPDGMAARISLRALYESHLEIQKILNSDLKEDSDVTKDKSNAYVEYLDRGVCFSNEFTEEDQQRFRSECQRRRDLRWRVA